MCKLKLLLTTKTKNNKNIEKKSEGFDALGDVLKPGITSTHPAASNQTTIVTAGALGMAGSQQQQQLLTQQQQQQQFQQQQQQTQPTNTGKILTGDLDSSLMSLVDNLNINKSSSAK